MIRLWKMAAFWPLVLSSMMLGTAANAAVTVVHFTGQLTSAQNNVFDDPDISTGDFFYVGQHFSGTLRFDPSVPPEDFEGSYFLDLSGFDVFFDDQDYSDRFMPRNIFRSNNGDTEFLSGGADQGGSVSLKLNLGSFFGSYPTAGELNGRMALFEYNDFQPFGGQLAGEAVFTSGVPEPASWAMLIIGFGMIGGTARRVGMQRRGAKATA